MKKKLSERLLPLVGLLLFAGALWVLYHELRGFRYTDVTGYLRALPAYRVLLALALTALSYAVLVGYDALALLYVRHPLPVRKTALASFISYAFSGSLGHVVLIGGAVRYRLYSFWGVTGTDISRIVVFASMTFWLGFCLLGGIAFLAEPMAIPRALHLPVSLRVLGGALLAAVACYLGWTGWIRRPLKIRSWTFSPPTGRMPLAQIALASADLVAASSVLYVLLPHTAGFTYLHLVGVYLLAIVAGVWSQVPGGLGVFETVVVLLLTPTLPAASVLGALLAFRGIYYLLPLLAAAGLFAVHEIRRRSTAVEHVTKLAETWAPRVVPRVLAVTTFLGGVILLFSGATPAIGSRMAWLNDIIPLPLIELSHFLGSLIGAGLLFLAMGLRRRMDAAYVLTLALLASGIVASLLKGLDYEEATALSLMLAALLPCRAYFYRKSSLLNEPFSPGWLFAIALSLVGMVWLGLFAYQHIDYSNELWWRFTLDGQAPRSLRAAVGVAGLVLVIGLVRLLRAAPHDPAPPDAAARERVGALAAASPDTESYLALLGDKTFLFNEAGTAFVMYAVQGRSWISMGDPVGGEQDREELAWQFKALSDRHGGWPVFYEVHAETLPLYLDLGLSLFKLGEEAYVPLADFSLDGSSRKGLRYTLRKVEGEGGVFEVAPAEAVPALLPELQAVSDAWLSDKSTREKGFSLGSFDESYLRHFPVALLRKDGRIVAFANLWPGGAKHEVSIDLMRYDAAAPEGATEYLFTRLMLWGREQGYTRFSLGMAPLSGMEDHMLAPLWNKLGAFLFRYGEQFYNFQGLRRFKDKFDPEWEPRYLACPGGLTLPRVLADLAVLIAGGLKGVISK